MPRFAFSTVACPEWSLSRIAQAAADWDYDAIELATEGARAVRLASDPALTAEPKTLAILREAGVAAGALGTSIRYDEPVFPPVVGYVVSDTEACIRQTNEAVRLADAIVAPLVRVLPFETPAGVSVRATRDKIIKRLTLCATQARGTGVRIALENAGSFPTAAELAQILDEIPSDAIVASYSITAAQVAGEDPRDGIDLLGDRLAMVRVSDITNGRPAPLGEGEIAGELSLQHLSDLRWSGLVSYDYPRAWVDGLEDPETVLPRAIETMHHWYHGHLAEGRVNA